MDGFWDGLRMVLEMGGFGCFGLQWQEVLSCFLDDLLGKM